MNDRGWEMVKTLRASAFGILLLLSPLPALAEDEGVKGSVTITTESCPGGPASPDCRLTIDMTGASAKALYNAMRSKAERDECIGGFAKQDKSGLSCFKGDDGSFNCVIGYTLKKQAFGDSGITC
jgi:hypothetical protein